MRRQKGRQHTAVLTKVYAKGGGMPMKATDGMTNDGIKLHRCGPNPTYSDAKVKLSDEERRLFAENSGKRRQL